MVGNSLKSDIEPVLAAGAWAAHVPFHVTWAHERGDDRLTSDRLARLQCLADLLPAIYDAAGIAPDVAASVQCVFMCGTFNFIR